MERRVNAQAAFVQLQKVYYKGRKDWEQCERMLTTVFGLVTRVVRFDAPEALASPKAKQDSHGDPQGHAKRSASIPFHTWPSTVGCGAADSDTVSQADLAGLRALRVGLRRAPAEDDDMREGLCEASLPLSA